MECRRSVAQAAVDDERAFTRALNRTTPDWNLMRLSIEAGITHHPDGLPIINADGMSEAQKAAAYAAMCSIADAMNVQGARRGELRNALHAVGDAFGIEL